MKKIFLILGFFLAFLLNGIFGVYAENSYKGQPVFKIYNYSYDKISKKYDLLAYGSAVYLGNNKILTNNHVIKNLNNGYNGYYEICETRDFTKNPVCFSSAELLFVNKTKDLALLKLNKSPLNSKKIIFSSKEISIGDKIETYGYPSNGGSTITFTSGKISGFNSGKYKIDASIDSGSSGGGVFDKDGKLVGLTTSVVSGYTTLGYLVTTVDIKNFLLKKGNISYPESPSLLNFDKFLLKYQNKINSNSINSDFFYLNNISNYDYKITNVIFDENEYMQKYYLSSNTGKTIIYIYNVKKNINGYVANVEEMNKNSLVTDYSDISQYVLINGKKYIYDFGYDRKTGKIELLFKSQFSDARIKIYGNINNVLELKNAFNLFANNSISKKTKKIENITEISGLKIKENKKFKIYKFDYNSIAGIYDINKGKGIIYLNISIKKDKEESELTLAEQIKDYSKSKYSNVKKGAIEDKNGNILFYSVGIYDDYSYYDLYIYRKINGVNYLYNINFTLAGEELFSGEFIDIIINTLKNIEYFGQAYFTKKEIFDAKSQLTIKYGIFKIPFKNKNFYYKNKKYKITKEEAKNILKKISGNNVQFIVKPLTLIENYKLSKNNLLKIKNGKKYYFKFHVIIPKLRIKKLELISKRIEKIDLSNRKFKKYREILEYLKYEILIELEKKKRQ